MSAATEALDRLAEGNRRFVASMQSDDNRLGHLERAALAKGQNPFAIILGCSDSRVPAELVFDQGLGDLFVIRVAGNIVAPSQIGSVEFAVEQFGVPLVVVLGHSSCGAVEATVQALRRDAGPTSPNIAAIVDRIRPAVEPLMRLDEAEGVTGLVADAVRANVAASVRQLAEGSAFLSRQVETGSLMIVGAEYSLETGVVALLERGEST
ncbi:MAG: carbonic anhydrase [Xanthomonadales bacterium]|nr:carbonic anhydrase [Xanthomonadales bacterium]